jgi:hypothetical protein
MHLRKIDFINILELAGLLKISEHEQESSTSALNKAVVHASNKAFVQVDEEFRPLLLAFTSLLSPHAGALNEFKIVAREKKHKVRFILAEFEGRYSKETFLRSKCFSRIDIDKDLPLEDVLAYIETLPLVPTALSKTNKGWHIFYSLTNSSTLTKMN